MEIIKKEKVDWYETLLKAEPSKILRVDYDDRFKVRTAISNDIKKSHPEMQFFTKIMTEDGVQYLMVIRLK